MYSYVISFSGILFNHLLIISFNNSRRFFHSFLSLMIDIVEVLCILKLEGIFSLFSYLCIYQD